MQLPVFDMAYFNKNGRTHIIIMRTVFDITDYVSKHPGGKAAICVACSQNGFECLIKHHRRNTAILERRLRQLAVGRLAQDDASEISKVSVDIDHAGNRAVAEMFLTNFGVD